MKRQARNARERGTKFQQIAVLWRMCMSEGAWRGAIGMAADRNGGSTNERRLVAAACAGQGSVAATYA
jgi:hypothetical protein